MKTWILNVKRASWIQKSYRDIGETGIRNLRKKLSNLFITQLNALNMVIIIPFLKG